MIFFPVFIKTAKTNIEVKQNYKKLFCNKLCEYNLLQRPLHLKYSDFFWHTQNDNVTTIHDGSIAGTQALLHPVKVTFMTATKKRVCQQHTQYGNTSPSHGNRKNQCIKTYSTQFDSYKFLESFVHLGFPDQFTYIPKTAK